MQGRAFLAGVLSVFAFLALLAATTQIPVYTVMVDGVFKGQEPALNFTNGGNLVFAASDNAAQRRVDLTTSANTAVTLSKTQALSGVCRYVRPAGGIAAFAYNFGSAPPPGCQALTAYYSGMEVTLDPDADCGPANNAAPCTLNLDNVGIMNVWAVSSCPPAPAACQFAAASMRANQPKQLIVKKPPGSNSLVWVVE